MKRNVFLLAMCQGLMLTATSLLLSTSALIGARLTEDQTFATVPLALQFFGMMLASFSASMIMKKVGRRSGFLIGLFIALFGVTLSGTAIVQGSFLGYCAGSLMMGIFNGFGAYYRFAAVEVAPPSFRARAISYVMAGGIAAAFIGPNFAAISRDWIAGAEFAGSYYGLITVYLLSIVCISFINFPQQSVESSNRVGRPLRQIIRQPVFFVAVFGALVGYGVMNLIMSSTPLAMDACGFAFGQTAQVIQWHVVGMFLPSFFTGNLIDRFGVLNIMIIGAVVMLLTLAVNLHGITYAHFIVALILLGIGWNFLFVGGTTLLTEAYESSEKSKTQGVNDFMIATTVTFTALSSGYLNFTFGWTTINLTAIPAVLFVLCALIWLKRKRN